VIAGLARADAGDGDMVALLAGDVPRLPEVLPLLIARWWGVQNSGGSIAPADGVIAVDDDGRRQPLLSLVRADRLRTAIAYRPRPLDWVNASMTSLLAPLALVPVTLSHGMARDVDTPDDAQHFGIVLDEPRAAVLQ